MNININIIKRRYNNVESLKIMGRASTKVLGPNIEVLLWNVFKCKKKGWQDDFITLTSDKDLILLQEAIVNCPFDHYFKRSSQHQWIMARSFRNVKTNIETGVKTGSTVTAKKHYCSASKHQEPVSKTKKMLLATVYPIQTFEQRLELPVEANIDKSTETDSKKNSGTTIKKKEHKLEQSLLVVNTHLINFVAFNKFCAHLDQVFQTLEHHDGPILLAGDFNTWNGKRLKYFHQLALSFSLEEVKMVRQPRLNHLLQHLDHIYCRGLTIVDSHVHTHIHSSDHYPISLTLSTLTPARIKHAQSQS